MQARFPFCAWLLAALLLPATAWGASNAPKERLNTIRDVYRALAACWVPPPDAVVNPGLEITVQMSFKRDGEVFGARITYASRAMSDEDRALYHGALLEMLARCSPLPFSDALGAAIAGQQFIFHFHDTRREKAI